jgi:predicted nucleic acid-binding protein
MYVRKSIIDLSTAIAIQAQAEQQLADNEYTVNSMDVLTLAQKSGCSAYDCEFVSLATSLSLKLITGDQKLIQTFPNVAMTAGEYLRCSKSRL